MGSAILFARALALLAVSRLLLKSRGTTWTLRRLSPRIRNNSRTDPIRALDAVRRAQRVVGGACLPQAVALTTLLQRQGHQPTLILGCRFTEDRTWTAHAWVELNGLVLEPLPTFEHTALAKLNAMNGWEPSDMNLQKPTNR